MKEKTNKLIISESRRKWNKCLQFIGESSLLAITSLSLIAVLFIIIFIAKDAWPFFKEQGIGEFLGSTHWYPSAEPAEFGALANFYGTFIVTLGATIISVPLGVIAAVCLSDVLPFKVRQFVKPVIELLAAIPSVVYGFFGLVVLSPLLQNHGGLLLTVIFVIISIPCLIFIHYVGGAYIKDKFKLKNPITFNLIKMMVMILATTVVYILSKKLFGVEISSGTNALNVSLILGIMALPTIVSVSEDALQACGRDLREGSYALGATRAETIIKTVIPAASGGILAAVILGIMRAIGETMVVWMASGNTARIPEPWYNVLSPVRTLTASIAGDMGEAARNTQRYHVLFAMAFSLLVITFIMNVISQAITNRQRKKLGL